MDDFGVGGLTKAATLVAWTAMRQTANSLENMIRVITRLRGWVGFPVDLDSGSFIL